ACLAGRSPGILEFCRGTCRSAGRAGSAAADGVGNTYLFDELKMEASMKVSEAMTRRVRVANPKETVQHAAQIMASLDVGVLPVGENDRLVGMITDRDIAIRGVARGKGPSARVQDGMTRAVKYCFGDQDVE